MDADHPAHPDPDLNPASVARRPDGWRPIFGRLQIDARLPVAPLSVLSAWTKGHPHHKPIPYGQPDCVYLSAERLQLPGVPDDRWPGGGVFGKDRPALCLTAEGRTRSQWRLPAWFHPLENRLPFSYHRNPAQWTPDGERHVLLDTAKQGQEFVLDTRHYPESGSWLAS